jgi:hypothetical protein
MTDAVQIELIKAVPLIIGSLVGATGSIFAAWFSYKSATHSKEAIDVAKQTEKNTNGISTRLNAITAKAAHAEGVLEERNRAAEELSREAES